jgi:hypothetical protein
MGVGSTSWRPTSQRLDSACRARVRSDQRMEDAKNERIRDQHVFFFFDYKLYNQNTLVRSSNKNLEKSLVQPADPSAGLLGTCQHVSVSSLHGHTSSRPTSSARRHATLSARCCNSLFQWPMRPRGWAPADMDGCCSYERIMLWVLWVIRAEKDGSRVVGSSSDEASRICVRQTRERLVMAALRNFVEFYMLRTVSRFATRAHLFSCLSMRKMIQ